MRDLNLFVRDREKIIFDGTIRALSSLNRKGKFDVLPRHANFISLVEQTLIVHLPNGQTQELQVKNGVLKVAQNRIEVYVGIKS